MATNEMTLPFGGEGTVDARIAARDRLARERAVDPRHNVALEASAGTGKTRLLVDRYINLLRAGIDPANILAITFTRKAATEMRDRIMTTLREAAARGEIPPARWRELRDRTGDIAISTIDAFCLSLLREFPLEADVDPGFAMADDTELPRLIDEALDRTLRIGRAIAREDEHVALVFGQLGERRVRVALAALLQRRIVAPRVLAGFLERGPAGLDAAASSRRAAVTLIAVFESMRGGFEGFAQSGPLEAPFLLLTRGLRRLREALESGAAVDPAAVQAVFARAREYFLTQEGQPRSRSPYPQRAFASAPDWRRHTELVVAHAEAIARAWADYRRELNVLVSKGIWRMFRIAESEYRRTLDAHAVIDFSDLLLRTLALLGRMEEFSRSRYRLESRYHHVLVDEFQDTSRAQWELVSLLIQCWGEGAGLAHTGPLPPSIFIVGDRKQSIYGFRDADVSVLREAGRHIERLRPGGDVRRSISRSFRAAPPLLAFVNDICQDIDKRPEDDAFHYEETDRFPVDGAAGEEREPLGVIVGGTPEQCADRAAGEIARLLSTGATVRDRESGLARPVRAGDIGILFRSRESHRDFEAALTRRGLRSYVYKGLGFFDADEIKDVMALIWYLAEPESHLRAAAFMRSRFVGMSDEALRRLAPNLAGALDGDAVITGWLRLVERIPPAELIDRILQESAYAFELRGPRLSQARENLKKMRALLRRLQNRGYATIARMAAYLDRLAVGDEANAVLDAHDAVSLMTVHASKGLEFPIVFVVNVARGTGNRRDPVRVSDQSGGGPHVAVGDFQGDADEERAARDREETKRLLYVALTRARDRLYLATVLKDGRIAPGRGSLGEVLPASILPCFADGSGFTEWRASSGAVHRLAVRGDENQLLPVTQSESPSLPSDFTPLIDGDSLPRRAASAAATTGARRASVADVDRDAHRLIGRAVHRLIQRCGFDGGADDVGRATDVPAEIADAAVAAYRAICSRTDVRTLYNSGKRLHEVPFTMRVGPEIIRGAIDCLVQTSSEEMTILEFKTGRPSDEHQTQLEIYRRAAERLFPGLRIEAQLVYAGADRTQA